MKKIFFISILVFTFSVTPTFADGDMPTGTKTCQGNNCFADGEMGSATKTCQGNNCFAEGQTPTGTKTCQDNCFVESETENIDFISMIYKKLADLIK